MEVWYLETHYSDEESFDQVLLHIPNTDYWFGTHLYNDYESLESIKWTQIFWEAVKIGNTDKLTKLGSL